MVNGVGKNINTFSDRDNLNSIWDKPAYFKVAKNESVEHLGLDTFLGNIGKAFG